MAGKLVVCLGVHFFSCPSELTNRPSETRYATDPGHTSGARVAQVGIQGRAERVVVQV